MTGLILVATFFKFNTLYTDFGKIKEEGTADIEASVWYDEIAKEINTKGVSIDLGDSTVSSDDSGIYMDEELHLMIPVASLSDLLNCSAHVYDGNRLVVEKHDNKLVLNLDTTTATLNNNDCIVLSPLTESENEFYAPIESVAEAMGYSYKWDAEKNQITLLDNDSGESIVPASYDLRTEERVSEIKNQGNYGTCWAFAALSSLESNLLPEQSFIFSPDHMTIQSNFAIKQETGGAYTMAVAYLTAWKGPVLEADDPYGDGGSTEGLSSVVHVQEVQLLADKDYEAVKEAVFKYGGVQTSIYNSLSNLSSYSKYYNRDEDAYCYTGDEEPNHEVVIIGWDDNYSKSNFSQSVETDGAFICQNSWGTNFGDDGVFYISYEDTNVGTNNIVYTDVESTDNYDKIYQADLCGWVGQIGYNNDTIYGANVYEASSNENLEAVGFYATGQNAQYEVYVVPEFTSTADLTGFTAVASGSFSNSGFYTVKLDNPVKLNEGVDFAVVIKLTVPDSVHPLAVEYYADDLTRSVDLSDGEGYISLNGTRWEHVEETQKCNLCIKAYTSN